MYRELPKFSPEELLKYLRKSRSDDPTLSVEEVFQEYESIINEWQSKTLMHQYPKQTLTERKKYA